MAFAQPTVKLKLAWCNMVLVTQFVTFCLLHFTWQDFIIQKKKKRKEKSKQTKTKKMGSACTTLPGKASVGVQVNPEDLQSQSAPSSTLLSGTSLFTPRSDTSLQTVSQTSKRGMSFSTAPTLEYFEEKTPGDVEAVSQEGTAVNAAHC